MSPCGNPVPVCVETIEARHRLEDAFLGIVEKAEP